VRHGFNLNSLPHHANLTECTAWTLPELNNSVRLCYLLLFLPCVGVTDPATVAMRDLYMKTGQGFLLVFSITSSSSLSELAGLRDEIIRIKDDENVPIVICGNKADLEDLRSVPRTKGFSISQRWGAPYYEASARTRSTYRPFSRRLHMSLRDPCIVSIYHGVFVGLMKCSKCRRGVCRSVPSDATTRRCWGNVRRGRGPV
jgi:hypothetical protein